MQEPKLAIKELRRCVQELGFVGIQIGSHINKWPLSQPELFPIYEEAEKLGACIFVHPWDMLGEEVMSKYWLPWLVGMPMETSFAICSLIFGGIFEKLPKLRWAFAHGGGSFPGTIGRVEHGWQVRPDLCALDNKPNPRTYCGKFWVDTLVHDPVALQSLTNLVGIDKVVCGSDYPFPLGEDRPGELVEKMDSYTQADKAKILWKNGMDFLGLNEEMFLNENYSAKLPMIKHKPKEEVEQETNSTLPDSDSTSSTSSTTDSPSPTSDSPVDKNNAPIPLTA